MGIAEMKAQLEKLKAIKHELPKDMDAEAEIAQAIVAEQNRIDEEGQRALAKLATLREAEAWAAVPEERRSTASIRCVYDWPTHKRTMTGGDIESGRGILVVTSPDSAVAAKAIRKRKGGAGDIVDMTPETVTSTLMKATVYPPLDVLQLMLIDSEPLCQAAYVTAIGLTGAHAKDVAGKSES
jgi:hypothetical protein